MLGGTATSSVKRLLKVPSDEQPTVKQTSVTQRSHWRGSATGDDKHANVYRGGLALAAVLLWLTDEGDTS